MHEAVKSQRDLMIAILLINGCTRIGIQVFQIPSPRSLYHSMLKMKGEEEERDRLRNHCIFQVRDDQGLKQAVQTETRFKGFT